MHEFVSVHPPKTNECPLKRGTISCREYIWTNHVSFQSRQPLVLQGRFATSALVFWWQPKLRCWYSCAVWLGYQLWIHSNGLCHHWSCQRYGCSEESFVPWQWFRNHGKSIWIHEESRRCFFRRQWKHRHFAEEVGFFGTSLNTRYGCFQK